MVRTVGSGCPQHWDRLLASAPMNLSPTWPRSMGGTEQGAGELGRVLTCSADSSPGRRDWFSFFPCPPSAVQTLSSAELLVGSPTEPPAPVDTGAVSTTGDTIFGSSGFGHEPPWAWSHARVHCLLLLPPGPAGSGDGPRLGDARPRRRQKMPHQTLSPQPLPPCRGLGDRHLPYAALRHRDGRQAGTRHEEDTGVRRGCCAFAGQTPWGLPPPSLPGSGSGRSCWGPCFQKHR